MLTDKYRGYIAIDLGTTNSVMGYIGRDGSLIDVPNLDNEILTPSFIWLSANQMTGELTIEVGKKAKEKMKEDPQNVLCSYKTRMGLDPLEKKNVVKEIPVLGNLVAEHCSAYALTYLKKSAEKFLKENIHRALITVPARFTDCQRDATKKSAQLAGLEAFRLLDEPSAAAYYYLYKDGIPVNDEKKTVLVYDLGGGTFDVSLITLNGINSMQIGTAGNTALGGDNFDKSIAIWIANKLGYNFEKKLSNTVKEKLIRMAEQAKIDMANNYYANPTNTQPVIIDLSILSNDLKLKVDRIELTKDECFNCIRVDAGRTFDCIDALFKEHSIKIEEIDEVLLVGGSSKFPLIREMMVEYLNDPRFTMKYFERTLVDPDLAVGYGARLYLKAVLDGKEKSLVTTVPMPVGIVATVSENDSEQFVEVIPGSQTLPMKRPKFLKNQVTNVHAGMKELVFIVQQGYSKDPEENTNLGEIHIPLSEDVAEVPGSACFGIQMQVDADGCLSVIVNDQRPGHTGIYKETFKHYSDYAKLSEDFNQAEILVDDLNAGTSNSVKPQTDQATPEEPKKRKPKLRMPKKKTVSTDDNKDNKDNKDKGSGSFSALEW